MVEKLDDILERLGVKTSISRALFKNKATILELPKNKDIFVEGKRDSNEYILISGILHRYNISQKGEKITTGFYLPESVVTPHFARIMNGKSIFNLQTLTDALIAMIPVNELDHLRYHNQEYFEFGKQIVEKELSNTFFNEVVHRSFSAKDRLLFLRRQYPNLENLIPHHVIASYLGITNVSLSRLRKELSQK